jgi:hypothetical protein
MGGFLGYFCREGIFPLYENVEERAKKQKKLDPTTSPICVLVARTHCHKVINFGSFSTGSGIPVKELDM